MRSGKVYAREILLKKTTKYAERNYRKRMWFLNELRAYVKKHTSKNIVYFDESGFAANAYRAHGWAVRGQKIYGDVTGNHHRGRTNLITAQRGKSWLAPMLFNGGCNQDVVLTWIKDCLLPGLKEPSLIIMDNALHNKPKISELLEEKRAQTYASTTLQPRF